jgi:hypothetical protein
MPPVAGDHETDGRQRRIGSAITHLKGDPHHCGVAVVAIGNGQIQIAVFVPVAHGDEAGLHTDGKGRLGRERAVAMAEKHRHGRAVLKRHRDVEVAIVVEVGHAEILEEAADGVLRSGQEGPVTVPEADDQPVAVFLDGRHVEDAVLIQVACRGRFGDETAAGTAGGKGEAAVPMAG